MKDLFSSRSSRIHASRSPWEYSAAVARAILILLVGSSTFIANAQQRNRYWYYFGPHALRFDSLGPVEITSAPPAYQYASIADTIGNLQLIVSNTDIYNGTTTIVQNGAGPWGNTWFSPLIFPRPGSAVMYDVLLSRTIGYKNIGAAHVGIDLSLGGGQGGVVSGGSFHFSDSLCARIAGTVNSNGVDYWLLFHRWNSDAYHAFPITTAGLDTVPVVSHSGSIHTDPSFPVYSYYNWKGEMVFSTAGDRLALSTSNLWGYVQGDTLPAITELYDFDQATGQVTFFMSFPDLWKSGFCELSPDGSKFYVTAGDTSNWYLYQYDLASGDPQTILASKYTVYSHANQDTLGSVSFSYSMGMLAQAPDARIYVNHSWGFPNDFEISRIGSPNKAGADCDFQLYYLQFTTDDPSTDYFPNMLKRYNDSQLALGTLAEPIPDARLSVWPDPVQDEAWLKLPDGTKASLIRVADMTGRLLIELRPSSFTIQPLDLHGLARGAYVLSAFNGTAVLGSTRFVVE